MWIEITEADVLTVLAGPELAGYRSSAKAAGQDDPVAPSIKAVTQLVRGYVAANRANVLGDGQTIPERLLTVALDILAVRIPQRVGVSPTDSRAEAQRTSFKILDAVSAANFDIGETETPSTTEKSSAQSPHIKAHRPQFSRHDQDGL